MSYRLTIYPAIEVGAKPFVQEFRTVDEMTAAKDTAANMLLFLQDEVRLMKDYSNVFITEELVDGEWEEL